LAATVDTFIGRISPKENNKFEHIFLDEAGYCSLIKGATVAAYDRPITFLGDHMQLPPVCEFPEELLRKNPDYHCISLWAQSALYLEQALFLPAKQVFNTYINGDPLYLKKMAMSCLNRSYRFGEALANVLAEEVYTADFHGSLDVKTELQCIAIQKKVGPKKRTNQSEINAIVKYVKEHPDEEIGIITPYVNQRNLLREALKSVLPTNEADSVVTVHGSQGREWETVLFSVVDTTDKWFTDSFNKKSNGKMVINTAVSRAKKKLIIICDADYWETQPNQFITKLISTAEKLA